MLAHLRGNAVAYLALFVSLGGVSWAAVKLPRNSVGPSQLRKNSVTTKKVKDRALLAKDFKAGQLPSGARGLPGLPGARGERGPIGPTFADVGGGGAADPPATPDEQNPATFRRYSFTLPTTGRILLTFRGYIGWSCSAGAARAGIYVDGAPVPKSQRTLQPVANPSETGFTGLTGRLASGAHEATVKLNCQDGDLSAGSENTRTMWSAVLVGG